MNTNGQSVVPRHLRGKYGSIRLVICMLLYRTLPKLSIQNKEIKSVAATRCAVHIGAHWGIMHKHDSHLL